MTKIVTPPLEGQREICIKYFSQYLVASAGEMSTFDLRNILY